MNIKWTKGEGTCSISSDMESPFFSGGGGDLGGGGTDENQKE